MDESTRAKLATQELGFGDYLQISVRYFKWEMLLTMAVTLAVNFPINFLGEFLSSDPKNIPYFLSLALVYFTTGLLVFLCTPLLVLWLASVIRQKSETGTASWMEACNDAAERFLATLWVLLLQTFIVGGLFLFLIVPGIILLVFLTFSLPIVAITNLRGPDALDYSKQLVNGRWWSTAGYLFFYNFLALVLVIAFGSVTVVFPLIFWPESSIVSAFANTLAQIVAPINLLVGILAPIVSVPVTIWFLNRHLMFKGKQDAVAPIEA